MTYSTKELAHIPEPMKTIRAMRRQYKLTRPEMAAMLGVHTETLGRWELGKSKPRKAALAKLFGFAERWRPTLAPECAECGRARGKHYSTCSELGRAVDQAALEKRGQLRLIAR